MIDGGNSRKKRGGERKREGSVPGSVSVLSSREDPRQHEDLEPYSCTLRDGKREREREKVGDVKS